LQHELQNGSPSWPSPRVGRSLTVPISEPRSSYTRTLRPLAANRRSRVRLLRTRSQYLDQQDPRQHRRGRGASIHPRAISTSPQHRCFHSTHRRRPSRSARAQTDASSLCACRTDRREHDHARCARRRTCARARQPRSRRTRDPRRSHRLRSTARLQHPEADDWLMYRRTYDGWGFSPLKEITSSNIQKLSLAWSMSTDLLGAHDTTAIVNHRRMFITTPQNNIIGDAKTGTQLWRY